MLAIQMNINVLVLVATIVAAAVAGYLLRSAQIASLKKKVINLENEMLSNHAEILELSKENAGLQQKIKHLHIPVISIKTARDEKSGEASNASAKTAPSSNPGIKKAGS
jgi:cell division protein FtsL